MLLETLDIKRNDLIIYSQNIFNLNNNFKVLYKDDPALQPRSISYSEVCACINEFTPKTLILYRLLTNITNFPDSNYRYGFPVLINNFSEIIYLDPIFALKEMEEYISSSGNYDLRFRIQQVGLTTLTRKNKAVNYAEVFCVDMTGVEALHENDKVFVDALLAKGVFTETKEEKEDPGAVHTRFTIANRLSEDETYDYTELSIINRPKGSIAGEYDVQKSAEPVRRSFSEFLKSKTLKPENQAGVAAPILEIFYSNDTLENHIEGKKETNVVLKIEPEQ